MDAAHGRVTFMVVGTPRSGTTLVQRLATEIPGVSVPPETHFFTEFVPQLLGRRTLPLSLEAVVDEVHNFTSLPTSSGMPVDAEQVRQCMEGPTWDLMDLFDALVAALAGPAAVLGEKTPEHLLWWKPISIARPAMKFVVVVRDPRAVVASNLRADFRQEAVARWEGNYHLAMAVHWSHQQQVLAAMRARLGPDQVMLLRYEDVVEDPSGLRASLARFLGRPEPDGAAAGTRPNIVLPWEMWKTNALAPITDRQVDAWRHQLPVDDAAMIVTLCRAQMVALGYLPGGSRKLRSPFSTRSIPRAVRSRLHGLRSGLAAKQAQIDSTSLGPVIA